MKKIWDISPSLQPGIPVWPGDTAYEETRTWELDENCPVNVSRYTMSTHTGAHVDAPFHYDPHGIKAGEMDLNRYLGVCQVIDLTGLSRPISIANVKNVFEENIQKVLFKTYEYAPQHAWDSNFISIEAATIEWLASKDVHLVGVDTASLDPQDSKTLDAHHMVKKHGLSILEGIVLDDVSAGKYELIALPLKLANLDAAPVRAILREI
ncbi:arylformamidase [Curvivirga sp.]|uniref:arylformamidase n=1 Tax=Curvivirga sp. TaxID=2856848 RepID=UPI003B58F8A2